MWATLYDRPRKHLVLPQPGNDQLRDGLIQVRIAERSPLSDLTVTARCSCSRPSRSRARHFFEERIRETAA